MRRLLLVLSFFLSLEAGFVDNLIADGDEAYARHTNEFYKKALVIYEEAYFEAKKQGSYSLRFETLEKIIKTSKKLNRGTDFYESKLQELDIPVFKNYTIRDKKIVLRFSKNIRKDHYRLLFYKNNFVVDVFCEFNLGTIREKVVFADSVTFAKYKRALMRIVIASEKKQEYSIFIWNNALIIDLKNPNMQTQEARVLQKPESQKDLAGKNDFINPKNKKIIVIDPGHGGKDSGAVGVCGLQEKTLVLSISRMLEKELQKRKYEVFMTRKDNSFIELTDRTSYANKKNAHIFISIHGNSLAKPSETKGVETYFLSAAKTQKAKRIAEKENAGDLKAMELMSKLTFLNFLNREKIVASNKLAIDLQKGILISLRKKYDFVLDGGVREGPFWVLVGAQMPAVLVEVGFLSNDFECKRLKDFDYKKTIAKGLADGIDNFFIHNKGY